MVSTVGCPLLWVGKLVSAAQLETETQVRKLKEELRLENIYLVIYYASFGTGKQSRRKE